MAAGPSNIWFGSAGWNGSESPPASGKYPGWGGGPGGGGGCRQGKFLRQKFQWLGRGGRGGGVSFGPADGGQLMNQRDAISPADGGEPAPNNARGPARRRLVASVNSFDTAIRLRTRM